MKRLLPILLAVAVLAPLVAWAVTATFNLLSPGTPPSARRSTGAAIEPGTADRLHIFGGYNGSNVLGTHHVFDTGTGNWSTITPVASLGTRERHALGWDSVRGQLVLFGGDNGTGFLTTKNEVWVYSPAANTWTKLTNSTTVPARSDVLFVYLPHLGKFFVFGGATNVQFSPAWVNDAWLLDAPASGTATWTALTTSGTKPVASGAHCAAYDHHRRKVILFGGESASGMLSATMQFDVDTNTWSTDPATGDVPSARAFCGTTYDSGLRRVILYGGQDSAGAQLDGLYVYDPVTFVWTRITTLTSPGALSDTTMAFSPGTGMHFLYGGQTATSVYDGRTHRLGLVGDVGASPTANAGADFNLDEDQLSPLVGSGTGGPPLTYQWSQTLGPAVTLTDDTSPTASFQSPRVTTSTALTFSLEVSDGVETATDSVTVTVLDTINEPPTANAGTDSSVGEGVSTPLSGSGSDPNGETLTYAWQQLSGPGVSIATASAASTSFTSPGVVSPQSLVFQLTVTDSRLGTATDQVTVQVQDTINESPTANAGSDATVNEAAPVTLTATASDPNGETLGILWEQLSGTPVTLTNPTSLNAGFTSPTVTGPQVLVFRVTATDPRAGTASDSVSITVGDTLNEPPLTDAGPDASAGEGVAAGLSATASDPNGEALSYAWVQVAGPTVTLSNANSASPTFTTPRVVTDTALRFRLTVVDPRGGEAIDEVTFSVLDDLNEPPVASAGADQSARVAATVTLDATASSDPNAEPLGYVWTQLSGTAQTLSGANTAQPSFVVPAITVGESATFEVTVSDTRGGSATDQVTVQLLPPALPCAFLSSAAAPTAVCGSRYQGAVQVEGDGPFTYSLDSAPPGAVIDPLTGAVEWTPTADQGGNHTLTVRCSGEGGDAVQQWAVTVDCTPQNLAVGCGCSGSGASPLFLALGCLLILRRGRQRG